MDINISDITEKGNPTTPRLRGARVGKIFIPTLVILVGIGGFGLGKLTKIQETRLPIKIITPVVGTMSPPKIGGDAEGRGDMTNSVTSTTTPRRVYVAARGGTVYYLPSCAGANRISEKNKIWFETKAEAERLGYRPAQNCKGL